MADQLATPQDLAALLERDDLDLYKATMLVECATAVVQATVEQRIVEVEDDEVEIDLDGYDTGLWLDLPERPVTAVTAVAIGATAVTDYTPQLRRGRLWRAGGWRSTLLAYPGSQPSAVTVTYTHGYPTGHQRLQLARGAVLGLARAPFDNVTGVTREQIDDYAVVYEAMSARMEASPNLATALRRQYSRPPQSVQLITTGG